MEKVNQSGIIGKIGDCLIHDLVHRTTKQLTEAEMLEELKTWNDDAWKQFKRDNYEVIELGYPQTDD